MIPGANVENAASPSGQCAERSALGAAVTLAGMRRSGVKAVGVCSDLVDSDDGNNNGFCSPCGMCRQALREYCEVRYPILVQKKKKYESSEGSS